MTDQMPQTPPVEDWTSDYDIFDPDYLTDPTLIWDDLRNECPVAHTERWGGSWLPTKYDDVVRMARMVDVLSSTDPIVVRPPENNAGDPNAPESGYTQAVNAPPISSDAPVHTWSRRLILPAFSPRSTANHEPYTRALCHQLIDELQASGDTTVDAATNYAQQIPPRVIARLLGIDEGMSEQFTDWVRGVLELGLTNPPLRQKCRDELREFFMAEIKDRIANPGEDLISELLAAKVDGEPVDLLHVAGTCNLMLVAGIDTTWSSIGSALWHLATHPEDRERLIADPELIPTAVEELLRAYSPVTMARVATDDVDFNGCPIKAGDKILMNFPGANRDPEMFDNPDEVIIDRQQNRHVAFGVGIHRCAGSNLARMEMQVAIEVWLERFPKFTLDDADAVTWAGGQVRGPRFLPIAVDAEAQVPGATSVTT